MSNLTDKKLINQTLLEFAEHQDSFATTYGSFITYRRECEVAHVAAKRAREIAEKYR